MTDLYVTKVEVPLFINGDWSLWMALRAGALAANIQEGDKIRTTFDGIRKDVDGWPLKIYTLRITRN